MDKYTAYLKVVETCSQKEITPQEACKELNIAMEDFVAGSLLGHKPLKKDVTERTKKNRKYYYQRIQPETEKKYYKVNKYLKQHPNLQIKDICPKFDMSTTSYYKANRMLKENDLEIKTPMKETKTPTMKTTNTKPSWQDWSFTPATEEKCRKGVELQMKDPSLSNGDIAKKFGISKSSYYAYRSSIGLVDKNKGKRQMPIKKPQMPIKKTRSKKERAVAVQTIHYVPDEPKKPEKSLMEIVTKPKKHGMVIVGDVDFLAEFARKLQGDKE